MTAATSEGLVTESTAAYAKTRGDGRPQAPLVKRGEVVAGNRRTTEPSHGASWLDHLTPYAREIEQHRLLLRRMQDELADAEAEAGRLLRRRNHLRTIVEGLYALEDVT